MSKSTTSSSESSPKLHKSLVERIKKESELARLKYRVPLYPLLLLYAVRSDMGRKKHSGHNILWLRPEGSEKRAKNGLCDFASEFQCYERQCYRWRLKYSKELDTLKGDELIKAIAPDLLKTDIDTTNLKEA